MPEPIYNDEERFREIFGEHYIPPTPVKKRYKRIRTGTPKSQREYAWTTPIRKRKREKVVSTVERKPVKKTKDNDDLKKPIDFYKSLFDKSYVDGKVETIDENDVCLVPKPPRVTRRLLEVDLKVRPRPTDEVQEQVSISGL